MSPIHRGMTFRTWYDLRQAVNNWAAFEQFSIRAGKKDSFRADYRCSNVETGCLWRVYASVYGNKITAKIINSRHTCDDYIPPIERLESSKEWLRGVIHQYLFITRETKAHDIVQSARIIFNVDVGFEVAGELMETLVEDRAGHQQAQFLKIPDYLEVLRSSNPYLKTAVEALDNPHGPSTFRRVFVCPIQSQISFMHMRKFLAMDGTFFRAEFVQTLLLAAGVDANGKNILLAWAVVESENESSWAWFLEQLRDAIPQTLDMNVVNDGDDGFLAVDEVLSDGVNRLSCSDHLKTVFCDRYPEVLESYFCKIADAPSRKEFIAGMEDLKSVSRPAAEYLTGIDTRLWVTAFSGKTFGHKTTIVLELMERLLKNEQTLSIIDLLHEIWNFTIDQRARRFAKADNLSRHQTFTDICHAQLKLSCQNSVGNTAQILSLRRGRVTDINEREYIVDLVAETCECGQYQDSRIPCGHAYTFIFELGENPNHYVPSHFTISTWKKTYNTNLTRISLLDVDRHHMVRQGEEPGQASPSTPDDDSTASPSSDDETHPPPASRSTPARRLSMALRRGSRPRSRSRAGAGVRRRNQCSVCGQSGHNRTSCANEERLAAIDEDMCMEF